MSTETNGLAWGFTYETINVFTLKSSVNRYMGKSEPTEPSTNYIRLELGSYYMMLPSSSFCMSSHLGKSAGMAQEAQTADQMTTFGAER